jgi:ribulose-5-phosphate 4-epimerase/fuculose-1-phosphate aldolase
MPQSTPPTTNPTPDEGVIKYACVWAQRPPLDLPELPELIHWRDRSYQEGFIGVYPDGIGYGNISVRVQPKQFLVSGTQTGHLANTTPAHYTLVDDWNIASNSLHCRGPVKASSESLTHAALYDCAVNIRAILHIHAPELWQRFRDVLPTTGASVPYGTPDMAAEMARLMQESDLPETRMLVMAGHQDGLLAFGDNLQEAFERMQALARR